MAIEIREYVGNGNIRTVNEARQTAKKLPAKPAKKMTNRKKGKK